MSRLPLLNMDRDVSTAIEPRTPIIIGLGNPGRQYAGTRHNLGFRVIEALCDEFDIRADRLECNALVAECATVMLAMPQTYMNRSGYAVRCLLQRREHEPRDALIVYDEVSLELGRMRLRPGGSAGGHRGMESIIQNLRTESIPRLRLGIAKPSSDQAVEDLVEFVLSSFDRNEEEAVEDLVDRACKACRAWISEGIEATMNQFNS